MESNVWHKSNYELPDCIDETFKDCKRVIQNGSSIHIISCTEGTNVKVSLYDILPKNIIQIHRQLNRALVIGFCRSHESQNATQLIPFALKCLILNFFPLTLS